MSYYLKSGNTFSVASKEQMDLHESLPVGNYVIKYNPMRGFYLEQIENFLMPKKMYGDITKNTTRILRSFHDRFASTGVLLCGEKGSGKSLLAKNLSVVAAKDNIPTLIINAAWHGDEFNSFVQKINQPCIVLLDEYEKVYDLDTQPQILTLLDGIYPSKKLFILTVNDKWRVDLHMRNRPGRLFYMINYDGLTEAFIREFCEDSLNNKREINKIINICNTFDKFNFDMLNALVEEMNRFNETATEAISLLNVKPEFGGQVYYDIELIIDGKKIDKGCLNTTKFKGNPLAQEFRIDYQIKGTTGDIGDEEGWYQAVFDPNDLKMIDKDQRLIFVNSDKNTVVLSKLASSSYNYTDYLV